MLSQHLIWKSPPFWSDPLKIGYWPSPDNHFWFLERSENVRFFGYKIEPKGNIPRMIVMEITNNNKMEINANLTGSLIPLASIYPTVQLKNLEKKTVSEYVHIKPFVIPLSFHLHPTSLSSSSHQGFGVTWASLGLSFIVGLSGYGTTNRKKILQVFKVPKTPRRVVGLNLSVDDIQ